MSINYLRRKALGVNSNPNTWGIFKTEAEARNFVNTYLDNVERAKIKSGLATVVVVALALILII